MTFKPFAPVREACVAKEWDRARCIAPTDLKQAHAVMTKRSPTKEQVDFAHFPTMKQVTSRLFSFDVYRIL
jgi:hypothetical protein